MSKYIPHPSMRQFASCPSLVDEFHRVGEKISTSCHSPPEYNTFTYDSSRGSNSHSPAGLERNASPSSRIAHPYSFVYAPSSCSTPTSPIPSIPASPNRLNHLGPNHIRSFSTRSSTSSSDHALQLIDQIIKCQSYYHVLGVDKYASFDDIRRAYLLRSRIVHPDKHPNNPLATEAFQRITSAYTTIKQASTRAAYDLAGEKVPGNGDETLYTTLVQMWFEFVEGNFDSLMMIADMLKNGNDEITHESVEVLLQTIRSLMQTCSECISSAKPGFFLALDLHAQLSSLPYLDLIGRLKLSLRLLHVLLNIPLTINTAAGGNVLPNWSISTLQAMIMMLQTAQNASGKVANVANMLGPASARDALKSVLIAGPLRRASDGIRHGLEYLVKWRPWTVWKKSSTFSATNSPSTLNTRALDSMTSLNQSRIPALAAI